MDNHSLTLKLDSTSSLIVRPEGVGSAGTPETAQISATKSDVTQGEPVR
jgi:hypothetical protein